MTEDQTSKSRRSLMRAASAAVAASIGLAGTSGATPNGGGHRGQKRFYICHRPPGNPKNEQTLKLPKRAAKAHLENHKHDFLGKCHGRK